MSRNHSGRSARLREGKQGSDRRHWMRSRKIVKRAFRKAFVISSMVLWSLEIFRMTAGLRTIFNKRSVAFVRLHHQEIGAAAPGIADEPLLFEPAQARTAYEGGRFPACGQEFEYHRGHRRFAARACDGDGLFRRDDRGKQIGAMDDGKSAAMRAAAMSGFDSSIAVETQTTSVSAPTPEPSC